MRSSAAVSGGAANAPCTNSSPPGVTRIGQRPNSSAATLKGAAGPMNSTSIDPSMRATAPGSTISTSTPSRAPARIASTADGATLPVMTTRAGGSSTRALACRRCSWVGLSTPRS